ncbi:MAG: MinD/ParA family protein [Aeromonadales bacterium]|nr:MinD/ParA family protein [Aeromonadales bacterium]
MTSWFQDQASGLRLMQKTSRVQVISVTGGKGGVGKTNITLNMAAAMAMQGKKVMVLDADLGLANVDVLLGIRIKYNLSHVLRGECTLDEVLVEGPHGVKIIPATSGNQSMTELSPLQHVSLIRAFSEMKAPVDILLVDTAAGISDMVLSFSRAAQEVMVVVCDEPTSITDAYALIKILSRDYGVFRFKIVANMVRSEREGRELFSKLTRVTDRFLDAALELVACIPFDGNLRLAVRRQALVVSQYPKSPSAQAIYRLADKAISWPAPERAGGHLQFFIENLLTPPMAEPNVWSE